MHTPKRSHIMVWGRPAAFTVVLMRADWEGPLGAVRLLDRPSWFTREPCSTARGGWEASSPPWGLRTTAAHPSPRP